MAKNKYKILEKDAEPAANSDYSTRDKYWRATSWYRENEKEGLFPSYIKAWAKESQNKLISDNLDKIGRNYKSAFPVICRFKTRGCSIPQESEDFFQIELKRLEGLIIFDSPVEKKIEIVKAPLKKDDVLLCDLEEMVDKIMNEESIDVKEYLKTAALSPVRLSKINKRFKPQLAELESINSDPDLKEAYKSVKKSTIASLIAFYTDVIEHCRLTVENVKRRQKPRTKKKIPLEKIIKDLKYMNHFKELNISSVDPTKVIGQGLVATYDTETRFIKVYEAEEGKTLSFRGTSLINVNLETVKQKKIRKPEKQIPTLMLGTKKGFLRSFDEIKSTEGKPSTRCNENTLFIRIFA